MFQEIFCVITKEKTTRRALTFPPARNASRARAAPMAAPPFAASRCAPSCQCRLRGVASSCIEGTIAANASYVVRKIKVLNLKKILNDQKCIERVQAG